MHDCIAASPIVQMQQLAHLTPIGSTEMRYRKKAEDKAKRLSQRKTDGKDNSSGPNLKKRMGDAKGKTLMQALFSNRARIAWPVETLERIQVKIQTQRAPMRHLGIEFVRPPPPP